MNILVTHGRVVDPASGVDQQADIAIADGKIAGIGAIPAGFTAERTIDATGCIVAVSYTHLTLPTILLV